MFGWSRRGAGVLLAALLCAVLAGGGLDSTASAQSPDVDYDSDDDGLIEVTSEDQLNAIRWDLDGDGAVDAPANAADYAAAFPTPAQWMGCPRGCTGYEVVADISLRSSPDWEPIGDSATNFTATFDGNAPTYTISDRSINRPTDNVGLFGATGSASAIRNVKLTSVNVTGKEYVGALAGDNKGRIDNWEATGTVTGRSRVGGLVGEKYGPITGSSATVAVTATRTDPSAFAGGLVGQNLHATISNSHASGNVTGSASRVGGLVGSNYVALAETSASLPRNAK